MSWGLSLPNEDQLKLVICTPQSQKPPVLESFLTSLKGQTTLVRSDVEKFSDIPALIVEDPGAVVLISILTKDDLPEVLQMLAKLEPRLTNGTHKIVVYNQLNNDKLISLLRSKGVSEVLEHNVSLKAFQYKFNKVTQLLHQAVKRAKADTKVKTSENSNVSTNGGKTKRPVGQLVFVDPIEHFSDFWMIMNPKAVRFVIGKWFTNFYGPGPSSGVWESYPETKNGEQGWVFNPRKADDHTFYKESGRWVFFGNCPEFSWEEKHWYFISKTPEFSYYVDKKVVHTKVKIAENGDVNIGGNSQNAKSLQVAILDSIEASIRLNDSTKVKKNSDDSFEKEKKSKGFEYTEEKPKEKEYKGRFSEQFEERKKKHTKNYECAELSLALTSKNGEKITGKVRIDLIELREKYVVLDVPAGMLNVDDQIELQAFLVEDGVEKKVTISAATQIVETEAEEDTSDDGHELRSVAICELNDRIAPQFIELVQSFKSRREEMTDFFSKAKGAA